MPEITKTAALRTPWWLRIAFVALVIAAYFCGLQVPLMGPDEPRYAQVAREMLQSGDWLTPTLGGHPWFEKPPLLYWLDIVSFNIFGVNEFAARLGPALFGLGTIAIIWVLGRSVGIGLAVNVDQPNKIGFTDWLALMAASTLGLIVFSHAAGFDIVLTATLTGAFASFYIFDQSSNLSSGRRFSAIVLFHLLVGLAILAKGLIGIVFPFGIIGLYHLLSRRPPTRQFVISFLWGLPLMLLIAAPWHLVMFNRYGNGFIDVYFVQNHFERFTSNKYLHPQPFYFYFWVLPLMTLPWMPLFALAIWHSIRDLIRRLSTPLPTLAISWLTVPLIFFSFSGSKLPGYIVPAVPAAAIITAIFTFRLTQKSDQWRRSIVAVAAVSLLGTTVFLISALPGIADRDSVKRLIDAADQRGYITNRVLSLYLISNNAEFYAAGRLRRGPDGEQLPLQGAQEVLPEIAADGGRPVLVLIPIDAVSQFTEYSRVRTEILKANEEFAIAAVSAN
jgi:4-amino-4-deoxy-L-arabinose transferase-like glycosyltransferase